MQAHLFLELWGPIFSFSSFWAGKCGAFWRHGFAKREVALFRFHRISDLTTVGNHWKSLGMRLDIFPIWLQTQRRSAPKSIPSCIERSLKPNMRHFCGIFCDLNKTLKSDRAPKKNDNLYFPTKDQQLILTAAHMSLFHLVFVMLRGCVIFFASS